MTFYGYDNDNHFTPVPRDRWEHMSGACFCFDCKEWAMVFRVSRGLLHCQNCAAVRPLSPNDKPVAKFATVPT